MQLPLLPVSLRDRLASSLLPCTLVTALIESVDVCCMFDRAAACVMGLWYTV
jgi:hypothetical protein